MDVNFYYDAKRRVSIFGIVTGAIRLSKHYIQILAALILSCVIVAFVIYLRSEIDGVDRWTIRSSRIYSESDINFANGDTVSRDRNLHVSSEISHGDRRKILSGEFKNLFVRDVDLVDFDPPALETDTRSGQRVLQSDINLYATPSASDGPVQVGHQSQSIEVVGLVWGSDEHQRWFEIKLPDERIYYAPVGAIVEATSARRDSTPVQPPTSPNRRQTGVNSTQPIAQPVARQLPEPVRIETSKCTDENSLAQDRVCPSLTSPNQIARLRRYHDQALAARISCVAGIGETPDQTVYRLVQQSTNTNEIYQGIERRIEELKALSERESSMTQNENSCISPND